MSNCSRNGIGKNFAVILQAVAVKYYCKITAPVGVGSCPCSTLIKTRNYEDLYLHFDAALFGSDRIQFYLIEFCCCFSWGKCLSAHWDSLCSNRIGASYHPAYFQSDCQKAGAVVDFDLLIIGGGAAGMSCALILGSAKEKAYAQNKNVGIILHQKASHLQSAVFNNALGIPPGTRGSQILAEGPLHLEKLYPRVVQIAKEKVKEIQPADSGFLVVTNKNSYKAKEVVVAVGYTDLIRIKGLEAYIVPHRKAPAAKNRIQLLNEDHLVMPGLYVAGTLAGHRSQYAIACGSGASVATDVLTGWNNGVHSMVHDKLE